MVSDPLPPPEEVVRLYVEEGKSLFDIALKLGTKDYVVRHILLLSGVKIRRRGGITGKSRAKHYRD
jgi:hypothetical protein